MKIVKVEPMAIPSRCKYGLDKLGANEAMILTWDELGISSQADVRRLRGLISSSIGAGKKTWAADKKFMLRTKNFDREIHVTRLV